MSSYYLKELLQAVPTEEQSIARHRHSNIDRQIISNTRNLIGVFSNQIEGAAHNLTSTAIGLNSILPNLRGGIISDITGSGTIEDPYVLYNGSHFNEIRNLGLDKHYLLGNNIDLSVYEDFAMFNGIFTGSLDGQGYTISGFTQINAYTETNSYSGLFQFLAAPVSITNLIIDNANVTMPDIDYTGLYLSILAARTASATGLIEIENVKITNSNLSVNTSYGVSSVNMGSFVSAMAHPTKIHQSCSDNVDVSYRASLTTNSPEIAGFCGTVAGTASANSTITECFYNGNLTVIRGGISGYSIGSFIFNVGQYIEISDCYSRATVTLATTGSNAKNAIGMFRVIDNTSIDSITNCYSVATLTGTAKYGFVGSQGVVNLASSYFDSTVAGTIVTRIDGIGTEVNAKTTAEMKTQSTFIGWDFSTIWGIDPSKNDGYPYLLWIDSPITPPETTLVKNLFLRLAEDGTVLISVNNGSSYDYKLSGLDDISFLKLNSIEVSSILLKTESGTCNIDILGTT